MDLGLLLAPSYRDLKYPTSCQNFVDTSGQIPKLILTLRHILIENPVLPQISCLTFESANSEEKISPQLKEFETALKELGAAAASAAGTVTKAICFNSSLFVC